MKVYMKETAIAVVGAMTLAAGPAAFAQDVVETGCTAALPLGTTTLTAADLVLEDADGNVLPPEEQIYKAVTAGWEIELDFTYPVLTAPGVIDETVITGIRLSYEDPNGNGDSVGADTFMEFTYDTVDTSPINALNAPGTGLVVEQTKIGTVEASSGAYLVLQVPGQDLSTNNEPVPPALELHKIDANGNDVIVAADQLQYPADPFGMPTTCGFDLPGVKDWAGVQEFLARCDLNNDGYTTADDARVFQRQCSASTDRYFECDIDDNGVFNRFDIPPFAGWQISGDLGGFISRCQPGRLPCGNSLSKLRLVRTCAVDERFDLAYCFAEVFGRICQ